MFTPKISLYAHYIMIKVVLKYETTKFKFPTENTLVQNKYIIYSVSHNVAIL